MTDTRDVVQRARQALDGSWEGEYAIGRLIGDLADEVEKQRAAIERVRALADYWEQNGMPAFEVPSLLAAAQLRRALDREAQ